MSAQTGLLQSGLAALEQGHYQEAIALLEQSCQSGIAGTVETVRSQINLARAYERTHQFDKATALCQELLQHSDPRINGWAKQALQSLSTLVARSAPSNTESTPVVPISSAPSTPTQQTLELLETGNKALKERRFADAVVALEAYTQKASPETQEYLQTQMRLVKAYKGNHQMEEAIALTRQLVKTTDPMVKTWAQQFLTAMAAMAALQSVAPEAVPHLNGNSAGTASPSKPATSQRRLIKSVSQLKNFYERHLIRDLQALESDRRVLIRRVAIAGAFLLLTPWVIGLFLGGWHTSLWFGLLGGLVGCFIWAPIYNHAASSHVRNFKMTNIVGKIVQGINPDLDYSPYSVPSSYSLRQAYFDSGLFDHLQSPDYFREDDGVVGWVGDTHVTFGEVFAEGEKRVETADALSDVSSVAFGSQVGLLVWVIGTVLTMMVGKRSHTLKLGGSNSQNERVTLFRGILLVADFNKEFTYRTVVLPDMAERLLGGFGKTLQGFNKRHGELVKLEDPEFEKFFAVYTGNQVEARYLLSTNLMERLVKFRKKSGRQVSVSFVHRSIYVAIAYEKDLFEPNLWQSMLNFKPIQEYFENLQLVIGIVDDLKLNRRIWTK